MIAIYYYYFFYTYYNIYIHTRTFIVIQLFYVRINIYIKREGGGRETRVSHTNSVNATSLRAGNEKKNKNCTADSGH